MHWGVFAKYIVYEHLGKLYHCECALLYFHRLTKYASMLVYLYKYNVGFN